MTLNPRIALAFVVGLFMVGGSYLLSRGDNDNTINSLGVVSEEQPVRSFIKVSDQDQDGLPDWQNSLKTPTINLDELAAEEEMNDTAVFAVELATRTNSTTEDSASIFTDMSMSVARQYLDKQYGLNDISVSEDNSPFGLRAYGNAVAGIVLENAPPSGTEDELTIFNRALIRDDETVLVKLDPIIASYEAMLNDMLQLTVPSSLTKEHLSIINVYQALLNDIKAFRGTFSDALPAMSRFRRYQADAEALYLAISALYLNLHESGIQWTSADTASRFIKIE